MMHRLFLQHIGQTSSAPMAIEIERAAGIYLYSPAGRRWIDFASGVAVCALGHGHPRVVEAVCRQAQRYMHVMVYGEYVESPQVLLAQKLVSLLPEHLEQVYFVNSGSEAVEGAVKLSKKYTGRSGIVAFKNSYHGATHGAMSLMGNEKYKRSFRPLLPDVRFIAFNNEKELEYITSSTACVVAEPIQAEAGVVLPEGDFLRKLRDRCSEVGALLVFDEAQTGMGRTGCMFAFEKYGAAPDILVLAKSIGGGMPLGAFIASQEIMSVLMHNPALGHITTFGGHPVSCAAGLAALEVMIEEKVVEGVTERSALLKKVLGECPQISAVRGEGLLLAAELSAGMDVQVFVRKLLDAGIATDGFLHDGTAFRAAPPLVISAEEIVEAGEIISVL